MPDEIVETKETEQQNEDYIEVIKELKETTVPKDDYNKLKEEHRKLLNAYVGGQDYDGDDLTKKDGMTLPEIEAKLFAKDNNLSNLEYVKLSLAHRNMIKELTGVDEYVPKGDKLTPEDSDYETAERVAQAFQHCIDYADGDSAVFTNELQRIMVDTSNMVRPGGRKK